MVIFGTNEFIILTLIVVKEENFNVCDMIEIFVGLSEKCYIRTHFTLFQNKYLIKMSEMSQKDIKNEMVSPELTSFELQRTTRSKK